MEQTKIQHHLHQKKKVWSNEVQLKKGKFRCETPFRYFCAILSDFYYFEGLSKLTLSI